MTIEQRLIDVNEPIEAFKRYAKEHPNATWNAFGIEEVLNACSTVDVVPVVHSKWEWFEEWNPSTTDHPRECDDCGWRCGHCKTPMADMVGGYWDDYYEVPKVNYCPNCGALMDGDKHE